MKVLFLDVDGVLNNEPYIVAEAKSGRGDREMLDPDCVARLLRVVEATGCKIVLSSTWRLMQSHRDRLTDAGIVIFDVTPEIRANDTEQRILVAAPRRDEINYWLHQQHPNVERIAVLDDDPDADVGGCFFRTEFETGLTDEIAEQLINHFRGGS